MTGIGLLLSYCSLAQRIAYSGGGGGAWGHDVPNVQETGHIIRTFPPNGKCLDISLGVQLKKLRTIVLELSSYYIELVNFWGKMKYSIIIRSEE